MTQQPAPIRVLVVDDSLLFRLKFEQALSRDKEITIVGTAGSAAEAMKKIEELHPDMVTLDVEMPKVSGIAFLRSLIPLHPLPVLVISSRPESSLDALEAGAIDFEPKPVVNQPGDLDEFFDHLRDKIKDIARSNPSHGMLRSRESLTAATAAVAARILKPITLPPNVDGGWAVIAIGASTGGTEAILQVVKDLPPTTPGIVIVQHMPPVFTKLYAERLNRVCQMSAKEAQDGDRVETGKIIVGAGDFHLSLMKDAKGYFVRSLKGEKVSGHCPSVDVLFQSAAKSAGAHCLGIILTGMGADGARGITQLRQSGAFTIGQNQESCVVYGMPMEAKKLGGIAVELPVSRIGQEILSQLVKRH